MKQVSIRSRWLVIVCTIIVASMVAGCSAHRFDRPALFATGFTFPEGPVLDRSGNLYLVNFRATMIHKITPVGKVSVVVDVGAFNNGATLDSAGNLYIASSGRGAILKYDTAGELSVVTAVSEGDSLLGPNDFAWDDEGRLYFTDPRGSSSQNPIGGVHLIDRDGTTRRFASGLAYPNGIAFDLDKSHLYISETARDRILRFEVSPDGFAGRSEVFFEMADGLVPDGMKLDVEGNLWVAIHSLGQIWCISPEGEKTSVIQLPSKRVTNITFGGPDMKTAYITALEDRQGTNGKVYTIRMPVAGVPTIPE